MIIRFRVKNFQSINDEVEFNMLPGDTRRMPHHLYKLNKIDLLRSAIIYGANGAGKSNLLKAVQSLINILLEGSIARFNSYVQFRKNIDGVKPTSFEIEFIFNNEAYLYGIEMREGIILSEWLYYSGLGTKEDRLIFDRKSVKGGKIKIEVGKKFSATKKNKAFFNVLEEGILRKDVPLLFELRDQKFSELASVYSWLVGGLVVIFPGAKFGSLTRLMLLEKGFESFVNDIMKTFDTGVSSIQIVTLDLNQYFGEDDKEKRDKVLKELNEDKSAQVRIDTYTHAVYESNKPVVKKLFTIHKDKDGKDIKFEVYEESDGTIRLLDLIPAFFMIIKHKASVWIDEIDQSIHVSLLKEIVRKFQNETNTQGQLIFTTHDSNLLDLEVFRQDEIWFAQKNKSNESEYYSLAEYDIRPELDIRKGYLSGRFGAIPFLGNLRDLNWDKYVVSKGK